MSLAEALQVLAAPNTSVATSASAADTSTAVTQALHVVGAFLAQHLTPGGDWVVVGIGKDGLDLHAGARTIHPDHPIYAAQTWTNGLWRPEVTIRWANVEPPADRPAMVFDRRITTGITMLAILDHLRRGDPPHLPVVVVVVDAATDGIDTVKEHHPDVEIITAIPAAAEQAPAP